jgi:hypothetical protein
MGGYHQVFEKKIRTLNTLRVERLRRVIYVKYAIRRLVYKSLVSSDSIPLLQKASICHNVSRLPQLGSLTKQVSRC